MTSVSRSRARPEHTDPAHAAPYSAVALDVAAYSTRSALEQVEVRTDLAEIIDRATRQAGVDRPRWHVQDAGDGEISLVPADVPKAVLVADFVRELAGELAAYNRTRLPEARIRVRVSLHHGDARVQGDGFAGDTPVVARRLVDCAHVRRALEVEPDAPLALIISDRMHEDTVAQRERGLNPAAYTRVEIAEGEIKNRDPARVAWVTVPGVGAPATGLPTEWPHLLLRDPDGAESTYYLRGSEVVVGRRSPGSAPDLSLSGDDQQVSRSHCVLRRDRAKWWITNASDNGTLLLLPDGRWVPLAEPYRMRNGDTLRIRATRLDPDQPRSWELRFFDPHDTDNTEH